MIAGILLFTFCSAGAAALYAFGRRQSSRDVPFAPIPAAVAGPVVSARPTGYETRNTPDDDEAGVPRWLRASVRAERFWTPEPRTPGRDLGATYAVSAFTEVPADVARTVVRDDVTLLDGPNESYAAIVGRLHAGDEVRVVLMDAEWAEVRTSNGAGGWVHSTALAGVQGAPAPAPEETPTQPPPRPAKRARSGGTSKRRTKPAS